MRRCVIAGLVVLLLTASCDRVAATYKPPFLPVKCAVGLRMVECKLEGSIVTQFGEFGVELDVFHTHRNGPNQQPDDMYILVIRHRTNTGVVDTLYEIPADRELTLAGDGPFLVEFGHRRGFADVSNGQVTFLELRDPNSPQPTLELGASPPHVLVPGTQRTNPTSKPPGGQPPAGGGPTTPTTGSTTSPPTQTPPPTPGTPTNVSAAAINNSTIRVSWTNHSDNSATLVVSNGSVSHAGLPPGTTTHDWGGLSPGTYMCFTVKAENVSGGSAWSAYGCTTTPSN